ncbi:hypothetical protein [Catenulispora yoronensis]
MTVRNPPGAPASRRWEARTTRAGGSDQGTDMSRGLRALARGLAAVLATGTAVAAAGAGVARAADNGSGPVATAPSAPATQTLSGVAVNGVRLELTLPKQLPVDLPGQQLAAREVDVAVDDAGGQGYTGTVDVSVTAEGSAAAHPPRVDQYDTDSGSWRPVTAAAGGGAALTVAASVTVPAGGSAQVRLRVSPGTAVLDDVKVSAATNGASVVGSVPVTVPTFQSTGLTASVQAGTPDMVTGQLTNPTDVAYKHVPVKLYLKACPAPPGKCFGAADVKLEARIGGAWQTVAVHADPSVTGGLSGTVFPDVSLAPGDSVQLAARMTLNSGAVAVNPVPMAFGPAGLTVVDHGAAGGMLTVQPQAAPPPTPTSTAGSASSTTASTAPSSTESSPSDPGSSTDPATPSATSATPASDSPAVAAGTPTAGESSSSATILVAAGLFAVCLALVLWFVQMKRRERSAAAARRAGYDR